MREPAFSDTQRKILRRGVSRLLAFIGASLALHGIILAGYAPDALTAARDRSAVETNVLHATLAPAAASAAPREPAKADSSSDSAHAADSSVDPAGHDRGGGIPLADTWYSASELDVRAEPLTDVRLDYPEALEGSGIAGRVRLLLFIDERGVVRKTRVAASEPERVFDQAAIKGWQDVRFTPAVKNGIAVKSQKLLELDFSPN